MEHEMQTLRAQVKATGGQLKDISHLRSCYHALECYLHSVQLVQTFHLNGANNLSKERGLHCVSPHEATSPEGRALWGSVQFSGRQLGLLAEQRQQQMQRLRKSKVARKLNKYYLYHLIFIVTDLKVEFIFLETDFKDSWHLHLCFRSHTNNCNQQILEITVVCEKWWQSLPCLGILPTGNLADQLWPLGI